MAQLCVSLTEVDRDKAGVFGQHLYHEVVYVVFVCACFQVELLQKKLLVDELIVGHCKCFEKVLIRSRREQTSLELQRL